MIREGYIPHLKKWIKLQDQTRAEVKADPDDNETHSDIPHLVPGGPPKFGNSQNSPNLTIQPAHLETRVSDSQVYSQICAEDEAP